MHATQTALSRAAYRAYNVKWKLVEQQRRYCGLRSAVEALVQRIEAIAERDDGALSSGSLPKAQAALVQAAGLTHAGVDAVHVVGGSFEAVVVPDGHGLHKIGGL